MPSIPTTSPYRTVPNDEWRSMCTTYKREPALGRGRLAECAGTTPRRAQIFLRHIKGVPMDSGGTPIKRKAQPTNGKSAQAISTNLPAPKAPQQRRRGQGVTLEALQKTYDPLTKTRAALREGVRNMEAGYYYAEEEFKQTLCGSGIVYNYWAKVRAEAEFQPYQVLMPSRGSKSYKAKRYWCLPEDAQAVLDGSIVGATSEYYRRATDSDEV